MKRLCIICEGQTEQRFVELCLQPHLRQFGVWAYPSLIKTGPGKQGGGDVTVARIVAHIGFEYRSSDHISTLVDWVRFTRAKGKSKAELEQAILREAARLIPGFEARFVTPYVQRHEFESLLFSDVKQFEWVIDGWNNKAQKQLQAARAEFATPEDINTKPELSPSNRLASILKNQYNKVIHGAEIAELIGLRTIRAECADFHAWITALEALGQG